MIVVEVLGAGILLVMAVAVTAMAIVGLIGAIGVVSLKRCPSCRHLHATWSGADLSRCFYCRHTWLNRHVMRVRLRHFFPSEMEPPAV